MHRHTRIALLIVAAGACRNAGNTFRATPPPTLTSDPLVTLEPSVDRDGDGVRWARAGAELTVTLDIDAPEGLDERTTSVTFTGVPLAFQGEGVWSRTLDGTEGDGLKSLDVVLVDDLGQQERYSEQEDGAPLFEIGLDFTAPIAGCALLPPLANATTPVLLEVLPTEPLAEGSLSVTAATGDVDVVDVSAGGRFIYNVQPTKAAYIPYTLAVTATDAVGNAPEDSLCQGGAPAGELYAKAPSLDGDPTLTATPSTQAGGQWRAPLGAEITVTLPTVEPIDPDRTRVALSDLVLTHDTDDTWVGTVTDAIADGVKDLDVRLEDEVGNITPLQELGVIRLDTTPPGVVDGVFARTPFLSGAQTQDGTLYVNDVDPLTKTPVSVTLTLIVTEPLADVPQILVDGPGNIGVQPSGAVGNLYVYELLDTATAKEGSYTFQAVLTDLAGNASTVDVPGVVVIDRTPDEETVDVDTPGRVRLYRAPWGTSSGSGNSSRGLEVVGEPGAAPAGSLVLMLDGADALLAGTFADDTGAFDDLGSAADLAEVHLSVLDRAGNRGQAVRVRDVLWAATLNNKRLGSTTENPHRLLGERVWSEGLQSEHSQELLPSPSGNTTVGTAHWVQQAVSQRPEARRGALAVYDPGRRETVLWGGANYTSDVFGRELSDTWTWDGRTWRKAATGEQGPPARSGATMAYDPATRQVILFGGRGLGGKVVGDLWSWDGTSWSQRTWEGPGPAARAGAAMAYDPEAGHVVLFGGDDGQSQASTLFGDTWAWDGTGWTQLATTNQGPGARTRPAMVHLPDGGVLLHGGTVDTTAKGDTWAWDGTTWSKLDGLTVADPGFTPAMVLAGGASSPHSGVRLLTGGRLWSFWHSTGTSWQNTWDGDPLDRPGATLMVDPLRFNPMVFGGVETVAVTPGDGTGLLGGGIGGTPVGGGNDTDAGSIEPVDVTTVVSKAWWLHHVPQEPIDWEPVPTHTRQPGVRRYPMMGEDRVAGEVVLFGGEEVALGGEGDETSSRLGDTWVWDGTEWTQPAVDIAPSPRSAGAMAFDPHNQTPLLFGGHDANGRFDETWLWDGTEWMDVTPDSGNPTGRTHMALATSEATDEVVMFGGDDGAGSAQTWRWNGAAWTLSPVQGVPSEAQIHTQMTWQPGAEQLLLFGGLYTRGFDAVSADTFGWASGQWTPLSPPDVPPGRYDHAMATDPTTGRPVVFGGDGNTPTNDLWIGTDGTWVEVDFIGPWPDARRGASLVADPSTGGLLLFGGYDAQRDFQDTWTLDQGTEDRPAHRYTIDITAAGIDPDADIEAIVFQAAVGASGFIDGTRVDHVGLAAWDAGGWRPMILIPDVGVNNPVATCWFVRQSPTTPLVDDIPADCVEDTDQGRPDRLLAGAPRRTLEVAVFPPAPNGGGSATDPQLLWGGVRTAEMLTLVQYRLPAD